MKKAGLVWLGLVYAFFWVELLFAQRMNSGKKFIFFRRGRVVQNRYSYSSDGTIDLVKSKNLTAGSHEG